MPYFRNTSRKRIYIKWGRISIKGCISSAVTIEKMKERKGGLIDIEASIVCERESHKGIIIGKGGSMLKRIGIEARKEIESMMDTQVNLQLWVKVRKEWRDSELYMKNYGYNQKEI